MLDEHAARLIWALPLVIALGVAVLLVLKRVGVGVAPPHVAEAPQVVSRTALTEHTTAVVVQFQQRQYLVFESTAHIDVNEADPAGTAPIWRWPPLNRKGRA